ncbi:hypothetical protein [Halobacillus campisalis]|uniref:Uncharacterized protein n=1 Tax=Halobacillus campisalis TaxID=435909 RepID=A0ABW2K8P2_9BACI|nr:hypothetical protein [Halobacillus campisalis]
MWGEKGSYNGTCISTSNHKSLEKGGEILAYLILSTYPGKGSRNSGDHLISKSLKDLLIAVKGKQVDMGIYSVVDHEVKDVPDLSKYTAILSPAMRPTLGGDVIALKNRYAFLIECTSHQ